MIFKHLTKLFTITSGLVLINGLFSAAYADTYKGGVLQEDINRIPTPTLNRNDIQGDPFQGAAGDNNSVDMLQLPPGSMDVEKLRAPAPPKKPFKVNAEDQGQGDFNGQQMMPTMEQPPNNPPPQQMQPFRNNIQQQQSNDPDGSAAMQLLWDAWHKRVAETIYVRFNSLAQMAFKRSQPLACQVSYMVARDGRVGNVQLLQKSANPIFNTMLLGVINSMNGNPVLEYPPNSRRQFVEKTGTFTWNYGQNGFKFTTGDKETIPGQGQQQMRPMQQQMQQPMQQQMQQPMQQQMQRPMQMMQQMQQMFGR